MDQFHLNIDQTDLIEDTDIPDYWVDIVINGRPLIDLVREVEQPFATAEGQPEYAGNYQDLAPWVILSPSRYLLPEDGGYITILICGSCGDWGCWPLDMQVIVESNKVIWQDFSQPHRSETKPSVWSYEGLGPFEFDRQQYEAELGKLLGDEPYQKAQWYWANWLRGDRAKAIQEKVVEWAKQQSDIRAVGLIGSWARGQANFYSDVDLVLLTGDPAEYRQNTAWPGDLELGTTETWHDTDHQVAWSRHITIDGNDELEMIFAPVSLARTPSLDNGTANVIGKGCQILYDPDGLLATLVTRMGQANQNNP